MFIKSDSNFSIFISDLRKLTGHEKKLKILSEKRKMVECTNKNLEDSNVLKNIYFIHSNYTYDTMIFIKAIGSENIETKKHGYLGLLISSDKEYFILTFNTLMKDLRNKKYREIALNFICNVNYIDHSYKDLCDFICTKGHSDPYQIKSLIAKCKISPSERISLVGSNESLLFAKIQLLLEKLYTNDVNLSENDLLFLTSFYATAKSSFLKVKLLQLYRFLFEKYKIRLTKGFFQCIENEIILPHEAIKPLVDISLSVEIIDLLYTTSTQSQKAENFLFRLIDSQNNNSRFMGFKLAIKHKQFGNQVLEKAIKCGIHNDDCFEAFMHCLNKSNYKEIYKRKEEIRFMMAKQSVKEAKSNDIIKDVLLKILELSKDDFYLKVMFENPEICITTPLNRNLSTELKMFYVKKLITKSKMKYFCLLYNILPRNCKDRDFYVDLFEKHLCIIINSKTQKRTVVLDRLITTFLSFDNLDVFRNLLISKFKTQTTEIKQLISDGIHLMNAKCRDKAVLVDGLFFIKYNWSNAALKIKISDQIDSLDVRNKEMSIKKYNSYNEDQFEIHEFEVCDFGKLIVHIKIDGTTYIKQIYS